MKKLFLFFSTLVFMLCFGISTASAVGVGLSASMGNSTIDWTADTTSILPFSTDSEHTGFGFSMDTNLARERMFNYRLEISKSDLTLKKFDPSYLGGADFELDGIAFTNDFGFGARMGSALRMWFGPELKFMWLDGARTDDPAYDMDLFGFGFGAAVGLNFNLPGPVTLAAKLAYVMMDYAGDSDHPTSGWVTYDGEEDLVYLTVTLFFRSSGDR